MLWMDPGVLRIRGGQATADRSSATGEHPISVTQPIVEKVYKAKVEIQCPLLELGVEMDRSTGIPTGAYQLLRIPTPLDPDPKGPVYDGGVLVSEGQPVQVDGSRGDRPGGSGGDAAGGAPSAKVTTPDELRNKYLFIDIRKEHVALLTLPERHSRGDLLIECHEVRTQRGQPPPLSQETLFRLMEDKRFRNPVLSSTDVRVCGLVPGTAGMNKASMDRILRQRGVRLPPIADLVSACAIHYATTGRHLLPPGRTVRAADGVVRAPRTGGQILVVLDVLEEFANDPLLVASGVVPAGERSVIPRSQGRLFSGVWRWLGL